MEITEQREHFLDFLRLSFKAARTYKVAWEEFGPDPEQLVVAEVDLAEQGFGGNNFWMIICPSLVDDGFLKTFRQGVPIENDQQFQGGIFTIDSKKLLVSDEVPSTKMIIYIDAKKGIYIDEKLKYQISGKRLNCVLEMLKTALMKDDLLEIWKDTSQISNQIKSINKTTKKLLAVEHDLITHSKSSRTYSLNREHFKIIPG